MIAEGQTQQLAQRWLVRPAPRPQAEARLICLPYAGVGASAYRPWVAHLPDTLELNIVQLPGREARLREGLYVQIEPLIEALVPAIEGLLDRPYTLFGHSMGALVAFELARALRRQGAPAPSCLAVSGRRAPQLPDPDEPLHPLDDDRFVGAIVRRYNGIPRVILDDPELLQLFLPTLRADLTLIETYAYAPEPPLDCPLVAFGGCADERARPADLAAWLAQSTRPLGVRQFPGDHFYLQRARAELVAAVVETHRATLGRSI